MYSTPEVEVNMNYQALTEKIAREGGLETDLKQFTDPLYRLKKSGDFVRILIKSEKYRVFKIFFGLTFFIVPSLFVTLLLIYLFSVSDQKAEMIVPSLLWILFIVLEFLVGWTILKSCFKRERRL